MSNWNYPQDLLEAAWGLIANAYGGDWDSAPKEWREAAKEWAYAYHKALRPQTSAKTARVLDNHPQGTAQSLNPPSYDPLRDLERPQGETHDQM